LERVCGPLDPPVLFFPFLFDFGAMLGVRNRIMVVVQYIFPLRTKYTVVGNRISVDICCFAPREKGDCVSLCRTIGCSVRCCVLA
jgi:hypothetical protein